MIAEATAYTYRRKEGIVTITLHIFYWLLCRPHQPNVLIHQDVNVCLVNQKTLVFTATTAKKAYSDTTQPIRLLQRVHPPLSMYMLQYNSYTVLHAYNLFFFRQ